MKKKLISLCVAAALVIGVNAQEKVNDKDVPQSIQATFKSQYPSASGAQWKMKDGKYKVHFQSDGTKQMASFDQSGTLVSKGSLISESELPSAISSAVKSSYANRSINEVYKMDKNGSVNYVVKLNGSPETKVVYSEDGQVIKDKSDW